MQKKENRNLKAIIQFFQGKVFPLFEEEKALFERNPNYTQTALKALKMIGISFIPSIGPAIIAVQEAINQEKVNKRIELIEKIVSLKPAELREISEATKLDLYTLTTIQSNYSNKMLRKKLNEMIEQMTMMNQILKNIYAMQQNTYNLQLSYFPDLKKSVPTFVPSTNKEIFKFEPRESREGRFQKKPQKIVKEELNNVIAVV